MEKYEIGDELKVLSGPYKGLIVKIENLGRMFKELYPDGSFNPDGIIHFEEQIKHIQLPYTFDGETLVVTHPALKYDGYTRLAYNQTSVCIGYYYDGRILNHPEYNHLVRLSEEKLVIIQVS